MSSQSPRMNPASAVPSSTSWTTGSNWVKVIRIWAASTIRSALARAWASSSWLCEGRSTRSCRRSHRSWRRKTPALHSHLARVRQHRVHHGDRLVDQISQGVDARIGSRDDQSALQKQKREAGCQVVHHVGIGRMGPRPTCHGVVADGDPLHHEERGRMFIATRSKARSLLAISSHDGPENVGDRGEGVHKVIRLRCSDCAKPLVCGHGEAALRRDVQGMEAFVDCQGLPSAFLDK